MIVAIVGSRGLAVSDLRKYLPVDVSEIVSGGARRVDTYACDYELNNEIPLICPIMINLDVMLPSNAT